MSQTRTLRTPDQRAIPGSPGMVSRSYYRITTAPMGHRMRGQDGRQDRTRGIVRKGGKS
jgi:hypothetical protein